MTDLGAEPMFTMVATVFMPRGFCAVVKDDHVIYAGRICNSPGVVSECQLFLNPKDFKSLEDHMKKQLS
jgi:hypothetical protein